MLFDYVGTAKTSSWQCGMQIDRDGWDLVFRPGTPKKLVFRAFVSWSNVTSDDSDARRAARLASRSAFALFDAALALRA